MLINVLIACYLSTLYLKSVYVVAENILPDAGKHPFLPSWPLC